MDQIRQHVLQTNRTTIIDNIADPLDLLDRLFSKSIFTKSMKQDVEAEKTPISQTRKILDIISSRGPTAYNILYECLVDSLNHVAADLLEPEYRGTRPDAKLPSDDILPEEWPNKTIMTADILVKPCNDKSQLVKDNFLSERVYSMKKRCRGRCLIISNKTFQQSCGLDHRDGTDKDVTNLETLFEQLHFNVVVSRDLTAQEINDLLKRESSHPEHASSECFICVICSHGTTSGIYGTDGDTISVQDVTNQFDGKNCPALCDKPKLFFIQACQGERFDIPVTDCDRKDIAHVLQETHICDTTDISAIGSDQPDASKVNPSPTQAHILVAYATNPGYISLRHELYGTWFLQAVVYVFQKFACKEDIFGMLTLVNDLVSRGRTQLNEDGPDVMQACQFRSSLTRKFMFFPEVFK